MAMEDSRTRSAPTSPPNSWQSWKKNSTLTSTWPGHGALRSQPRYSSMRLKLKSGSRIGGWSKRKGKRKGYCQSKLHHQTPARGFRRKLMTENQRSPSPFPPPRLPRHPRCHLQGPILIPPTEEPRWSTGHPYIPKLINSAWETNSWLMDEENPCAIWHVLLSHSLFQSLTRVLYCVLCSMTAKCCTSGTQYGTVMRQSWIWTDVYLKCAKDVRMIALDVVN